MLIFKIQVTIYSIKFLKTISYLYSYNFFYLFVIPTTEVASSTPYGLTGRFMLWLNVRILFLF